MNGSANGGRQFKRYKTWTVDQGQARTPFTPAVEYDRIAA